MAARLGLLLPLLLQSAVVAGAIGRAAGDTIAPAGLSRSAVQLASRSIRATDGAVDVHAAESQLLDGPEGIRELVRDAVESAVTKQLDSGANATVRSHFSNFSAEASAVANISRVTSATVVAKEQYAEETPVVQVLKQILEVKTRLDVDEQLDRGRLQSVIQRCRLVARDVEAYKSTVADLLKRLYGGADEKQKTFVAVASAAAVVSVTCRKGSRDARPQTTRVSVRSEAGAADGKCAGEGADHPMRTAFLQLPGEGDEIASTSLAAPTKQMLGELGALSQKLLALDSSHQELAGLIDRAVGVPEPQFTPDAMQGTLDAAMAFDQRMTKLWPTQVDTSSEVIAPVIGHNVVLLHDAVREQCAGASATLAEVKQRRDRAMSAVQQATLQILKDLEKLTVPTWRPSTITAVDESRVNSDADKSLADLADAQQLLLVTQRHVARATRKEAALRQQANKTETDRLAAQRALLAVQQEMYVVTPAAQAGEQAAKEATTAAYQAQRCVDPEIRAAALLPEEREAVARQTDARLKLSIASATKQRRADLARFAGHLSDMERRRADVLAQAQQKQAAALRLVGDIGGGASLLELAVAAPGELASPRKAPAACGQGVSGSDAQLKAVEADAATSVAQTYVQHLKKLEGQSRELSAALPLKEAAAKTAHKAWLAAAAEMGAKTQILAKARQMVAQLQRQATHDQLLVESRQQLDTKPDPTTRNARAARLLARMYASQILSGYSSAVQGYSRTAESPDLPAEDEQEAAQVELLERIRSNPQAETPADAAGAGATAAPEEQQADAATRSSTPAETPTPDRPAEALAALTQRADGAEGAGAGPEPEGQWAPAPVQHNIVPSSASGGPLGFIELERVRTVEAAGGDDPPGGGATARAERVAADIWEDLRQAEAKWGAAHSARAKLYSSASAAAAALADFRLKRLEMLRVQLAASVSAAHFATGELGQNKTLAPDWLGSEALAAAAVTTQGNRARAAEQAMMEDAATAAEAERAARALGLPWFATGTEAQQGLEQRWSSQGSQLSGVVKAVESKARAELARGADSETQVSMSRVESAATDHEKELEAEVASLQTMVQQQHETIENLEQWRSKLKDTTVTVLLQTGDSGHSEARGAQELQPEGPQPEQPREVSSFDAGTPRFRALRGGAGAGASPSGRRPGAPFGITGGTGMTGGNGLENNAEAIRTGHLGRITVPDLGQMPTPAAISVANTYREHSGDLHEVYSAQLGVRGKAHADASRDYEQSMDDYTLAVKAKADLAEKQARAESLEAHLGPEALLRAQGQPIPAGTGGSGGTGASGPQDSAETKSAELLAVFRDRTEQAAKRATKELQESKVLLTAKKLAAAKKRQAEATTGRASWYAEGMASVHEDAQQFHQDQVAAETEVELGKQERTRAFELKALQDGGAQRR